MGIKDLSNFLRGKCNSCFSRVSLSNYRFKKIAIDLPIYLYAYKRNANTSTNPKRWILMLAEMMAAFRVNDVHPVIIFEGRSPPEKADERVKRNALKEKSEEIVFDLQHDLELFYTTSEISEKLLDLNKKLLLSSSKRFIDKSNISATNVFDIKLVEDKIKKMKANIITFEPSDFDDCKRLFDSLKVPYYTAPHEAETMCYDLYKKGLVDEILSDDTDVLAYGVNSVLTKFDIASQSFVKIDGQVILQELQFTYAKFLDFCVLCGCDYNKNIFRIGPEGAFKLLKSYDTIEAIEESGIDTTVLKYPLTRSMFTNHIPSDVTNVSYCDSPNFEELRELFMYCNIDTDFSNLCSKFSANIEFV
jgi:5'-3' exonuclease